MKKKLLFLILLLIPIQVLAYSEYIIPSGQNIGIEVHSKGVLVVGVYEIDGVYPALEANLKIGDVITKANDIEVSSIDELIKIVNNEKEQVKITYLRNNKELETYLKLYRQNDITKTGLYVKDTITGIGSISFIDPETRLFGALGHEIIESNTGLMLDLKDGEIYESEVVNIERSEYGKPGSKVANLKLDSTLGTIFENTNKGIFGKYNASVEGLKTYKVADFKDIKLGEAKILTVLDGQNVEEYKINILKINKSDIKNILFEITDEKLLSTTGGVIQGMSGSPIIQNDKIIGAVTHVVVDNPNRGYGIFIRTMLEEAEN